MSHLATLERRTALAITAVLALLLTVLPTSGTPAAYADGSAEARLTELLVGYRASNGRPAVRMSGELSAIARRQAQRMADQNHLHHTPDLGGSVSGWSKVGENVGRGPNADRIQEGWRNSSSHDRNMLDPEWVEAGIGAVVKDGQLWAVQLFRVPQQAAPAPEPAPAPAPEPAPAPAPTPAAEPTTSAAAGSSTATAGSSEAARSADDADPTPEATPVPEPPRPHDVPDLAPHTDRVSHVLARLDPAGA